MPAETLAAWVRRLFVRRGVPDEAAGIVAECLVTADLRGVSSHGVSRVPIYVKRLAEGLVRADARPRIVREETGSVLIDAGDGFGHPAGVFAVRECLARARQTGVAVAGVFNSTHFGMAGYYAEIAARDGMIGVATTNSSPRMAPWGALDALLGTNPLAIAVPGAEAGAAVVLDMATSVVALGRVVEAAANKTTLPVGWALDSCGQPTTDPGKALDGTVLPMAGPKGSGLAFMLDVLSGLLTGGHFGREVRSLYRDFSAPERCGHFFITIDVRAFQPLSDFQRRMGDYVVAFRECRPRPGADGVFLPGELERCHETQARAEGVWLSPATHRQLCQLSEEGGVPVDSHAVHADPEGQGG